MNLVDRLEKGHLRFATGKERNYLYRGQIVFSIAEVIRLLLDRYAERFGDVSNDTAQKLHERLISRFSKLNPSATRKGLDDSLTPFVVAYPRSKRRSQVIKHLLNELQLDGAKKQWESAKLQCHQEQRRYVPEAYYYAASQTREKRLRRRLQAIDRRDQLNLVNCKKLIIQIKGIYRESP